LEKDIEKLPADFCRELFETIDSFMLEIVNQKLVDSLKVQDFCLDLRNIVNKKI
jgi:hypothetical protein